MTSCRSVMITWPFSRVSDARRIGMVKSLHSSIRSARAAYPVSREGTGFPRAAATRAGMTDLCGGDETAAGAAPYCLTAPFIELSNAGSGRAGIRRRRLISASSV